MLLSARGLCVTHLLSHLATAAALKSQRFGMRHGCRHIHHAGCVTAAVAVEVDAHILKQLIEQSAEVNAQFLSVIIVERAYDG